MTGPTEAPNGALPELEASATRSAECSGRRFLLLAAVLALVLVVAHATPLKQYWSDVQHWKQVIRGHGLLGMACFLLAGTTLIALGLPRMMFCALAGMTYGFARGSALALAMSLIGSYATFVFAHWTGRAWAQRKIAGQRRLQELLRNPTIVSVLLLRQLPLAAVVPNLLLGLSTVTHPIFLLGTFLGYLPNTLAVTLIGSGLGKHTLSASLTQMGLAMTLLAAMALGVSSLRRRLGKPKPSNAGQCPPA